MLEEEKSSNEEQETSTEPEQELDLDSQDTTEESTAEDKSDSEIAEIKAKLAEVEAKNKQLFARLKKEQEVEKKPTTNSQPSGDKEWKSKVDFVLTKGRDLDADDIDEIVSIAKGKGISYDEARETNLFKAYIADKQSKSKVARATPSASSKSTMVNGKTWQTMNSQEREANFPKFRDKVAKRA